MKLKFDSKKAFTLAETLIAMGIIGVVAALTIPVLLGQYQDRARSTAKSSFARTFGEALKIMNSNDILAGYTTTEDFVKELEKHYKIMKVCDTKPTACFNETLYWGEEDNEVDMKGILKAKDIVDFADGEADWGTNVVGLQFLNGVTAMLAYNPKCKQNRYDGNLIRLIGSIGDKGRIGSVSFSTNNCIAMIYDINGNTVPNRYGSDVVSTSNVKNLGQTWLSEINGVKVYKVANAGSYDPVNCTNATTAGADWKYCSNSTNPSLTGYNNDYWAGAAKTCGGVNNIISMSDATKLQAHYYNYKDSYDGIGVNTKEFTDINFPVGGNEFWIRGNGDGYYVENFDDGVGINDTPDAGGVAVVCTGQ